METLLRYRGRAVTTTDAHFIRTLIAAHPEQSRRALSATLCEAWDWRQENGVLRAMVCRGLMLALAREGHITLPPVRRQPPNPLGARASGVGGAGGTPLPIDTTPLTGPLRALGALTVVSVRRTPAEALFKGLMAAYHYLGYTQPVGEHLKFMVYAGTRPVALSAWSSAPRHLGPRDRFLGWSPAVRRHNISGIAYNTRFLILPWVQVPHLASHVLSRLTRALPQAWADAYGHPVYWAETFVDTTRYRGTCYRAANWQLLGKTQGRGKDDHTHQANRSIKDVLGLPLCRDYHARLLQTP
ncbi:Druantia anti-phage system protein DruA [Acidiferrobacter sp.]|uniref:Druantia anti-phage system protein DruA n=1 Tax=Acidiferrobacter sp. TaxID=1872107 RepID=UPI00260AA9BA|nr:Druantia anti-phage system protein DruA [Acidiferrobacter sp.]